MNHSAAARSFPFLIAFLSLLAVGARVPVASAQTRIYNPIPIAPGSTTTDKLTDKDVPTGQGGFARDYVLELKEGSQLAIDLTSDNFDSIVTLIGSDGATIAENDDGPDGSTNSLLFTRITKSGTYYIRVRAFGEVAGGNFRLKVTLLKPVAGEK
ncbi:PPC domain-containing protein [Kovacikia minuta CCNUW1]|uniref:PPC domain-containing protein n=1 Tax=Kovacikia minuta TaxID=2931930 RepID=UPI001CCD5003|nr:PPC domain-containing protein [Kovacikia minuta]UBF27406.1 PPC domain-containing protein [Kovacikia minuta CCNUW1]